MSSVAKPSRIFPSTGVPWILPTIAVPYLIVLSTSVKGGAGPLWGEEIGDNMYGTTTPCSVTTPSVFVFTLLVVPVVLARVVVLRRRGDGDEEQESEEELRELSFSLTLSPFPLFLSVFFEEEQHQRMRAIPGVR